jgi:uncharacterized protein YecT (DUF1311 family)
MPTFPVPSPRFQRTVLTALLLLQSPAHAKTTDDDRGYDELSKAYQQCDGSTWYMAVRCMDVELQRQTKRVQLALANQLRQAKSPQQKALLQQSQSEWQTQINAECEALRQPDTGDATDIVTECLMLKTALRAKALDASQHNRSEKSAAEN